MKYVKLVQKQADDPLSYGPVEINTTENFDHNAPKPVFEK